MADLMLSLLIVSLLLLINLSPIRREFATYMADPNGPFQVPHHCCEECRWYLVGSPLQLELLSWSPCVECLFLPKLGVKREAGDHAVVELARYFGQVVPIFVLNNPVVEVL